MSFRLDDTDRKILSELQIDAGQSLDEIAKKVFHLKHRFGIELKNERLWYNWRYCINTKC